MTTEMEHVIAAIKADQRRKTAALIDSLTATALDQVLIAGELLVKHLRDAPAGTTIREGIAAQIMTQPTT